MHELWLKDPGGNLVEVYARLTGEEMQEMPADKDPTFLVEERAQRVISRRNASLGQARFRASAGDQQAYSSPSIMIDNNKIVLQAGRDNSSFETAPS